MASLRSTRKSSRASLNKQIEDGIEDTQISNESDVMETADDGPVEGSAHSQSKSARDLLTNMVAGARKRHTAKKKNIIASHASAAKNLETCIDTLFNEHENKSHDAHEAQLKRLQQLLKHKAKLESNMATKLTELQASYNAHSCDLQNVLNARIAELK